MTSFELYVLILCIIVFTALTALFFSLIFYIIKLTQRLIRSGAEDEAIKAEYYNEQKKKARRMPVIVDRIVSGVLCCALLVAFLFSLTINITGYRCMSDTIPALSVVKSNSMSFKHEKNTYLTENKLDDQFDTFDLILTYKLPAVDELELYDVVLYEQNGTPVIHRIVEIEPPNDEHSEYYFLLQGDAIENPDRFPVYYSQMRGIYRGQHIPFVGSFIAFMQSVAGYLCMLLVVLGMIAIPLVEKKINAVKLERLVAINIIAKNSETENKEEAVAIK